MQLDQFCVTTPTPEHPAGQLIVTINLSRDFLDHPPDGDDEPPPFADDEWVAEALARSGARSHAWKSGSCRGRLSLGRLTECQPHLGDQQGRIMLCDALIDADFLEG